MNACLVAAGGAAGSVLRFLIGACAAAVGSRFPVGTLLVNILGCLAAGALLFATTERAQPSPQLRLFLVTGFLGGLTTFSAFGFETGLLVREGRTGLAILNILANVALSLAAVWAGYGAARAVT